MMYHSELYDTHNSSMESFIQLFNNCNIERNILMIANREETYKHDGLFIDLSSGQTFGYDWTRSNSKIFENEELKYKRLACIESKLNIPSSKLLITSDITESAIATAWHDDFMKESVDYFLFTAAGGETIKRHIRYTKNFKNYGYANIKDFKLMIKRALDTQTYNKNIF